jgi:hypothetical protein
MIRKLLTWLGIIRSAEVEHRREADDVLAAARRELKASREARRRELAARIQARGHR